MSDTVVLYVRIDGRIKERLDELSEHMGLSTAKIVEYILLRALDIPNASPYSKLSDELGEIH